MWVHQSRCSPTQEILGVHDKKEQEKIEDFSEASKVPLEHMFNSHDNYSVDRCLNTRASEEGKTYNDKDE